MLTSISPLGERARGHRWQTTVAWFITGAVVGGLIQGFAAGAIGLGVGVRSLHPLTAAVVVGVVAAVGVSADLKLGGLILPSPHRQVNERWLDRYRPWLYASGFGLQLGLGAATQVYLAATYLVLVAALFSGSLAVGALIGGIFGLARGMSILVVAHVTSFEDLANVSRRLAARAVPARRLAVLSEGVLAMALVVLLAVTL